jgi:F-type H+-transporting ATPase subunit a
MADPIHQFQITKLFTIAKIGSAEIAFTNSALYMVLAVTVICAFLIGSTRGRALVPGRLQSVSEMLYEFVADMIRGATGPEGMQFFPLVFSLFAFILVANIMGLIPYGFTVTSHLIITVALALLVFLTAIVVGFWKNGLHFLKLFVPSGIPIYILPPITVMEVFSFFVRPVSHSVRLFANMLAGHITLKVFAGSSPASISTMRCIPATSGPPSTINQEELSSWIQLLRNTSVPVLRASAWAAPASAWAPSSAIISRRRCAIPPRRTASSRG